MKCVENFTLSYKYPTYMKFKSFVQQHIVRLVSEFLTSISVAKHIHTAQGRRKMFWVGGAHIYTSVGPPPDVSTLCVHAIIVQNVPRWCILD